MKSTVSLGLAGQPESLQSAQNSELVSYLIETVCSVLTSEGSGGLCAEESYCLFKI